MTAAPAATFDAKDLEAKVKAMYRRVAEDPHGEFHFEMGRALARFPPPSRWWIASGGRWPPLQKALVAARRHLCSP
jgi:hypothetical protein